jgi:hypothetical protein
MKTSGTAHLQKKRTRTLALVLFSVFVFSACAKNSNFGTTNPESSFGDPGDGDPSPTPSPPPTPTPSTKMEALAWESSTKPERKQWSAYTMQVIDQEFERFSQAGDATIFCPKYNSLTRDQKINFFGQLIAGISYYESGWSPVSRMQETTMGTDPVTGLPVYSEGLLQLSYQDIQWATYCEFDWSVDKFLSPTDPKKTILDPYKNLRCGIKILADQIARKKAIVLSSGVYWAVIKDGGRYEKIDEIAAITKRLSFCP